MALVMWPAALFLELALLMREKFIGPEQPAATDTIDQLRPGEEVRGAPSARMPIEPHHEYREDAGEDAVDGAAKDDRLDTRATVERRTHGHR